MNTEQKCCACAMKCGTAVNTDGYAIEAHSLPGGWQAAFGVKFVNRCEAAANLPDFEALEAAHAYNADRKPRELRVFEALKEPIKEAA